MSPLLLAKQHIELDGATNSRQLIDSTFQRAVERAKTRFGVSMPLTSAVAVAAAIGSGSVQTDPLWAVIDGSAGRFISSTGATIRHGPDNAFYAPGRDMQVASALGGFQG